MCGRNEKKINRWMKDDVTFALSACSSPNSTRFYILILRWRMKKILWMKYENCLLCSTFCFNERQRCLIYIQNILVSQTKHKRNIYFMTEKVFLKFVFFFLLKLLFSKLRFAFLKNSVDIMLNYLFASFVQAKDFASFVPSCMNIPVWLWLPSNDVFRSKTNFFSLSKTEC